MKSSSSGNSHQASIHAIWMVILSFIVGIVAGFGALAFRAMIGFVHNLFLLGQLSFSFNTDVHTPPSPWGILVIFVPVAGSLIVTWLTQTFAPEAVGHGVPEVMNAIYYQKGKIRPVVAVIKSIASAVSIGTGGSVGREGPIVQIGSTMGSILGQIITMPARQRNILIAAGAGAGIAATFNAPLGGLAFAVELMLVSITANSVALVAVATVTATHIAQLFLGMRPSFDIPSLAHFGHVPISPEILFSFIPLGIIIGLCAALFIHSIYWFEDYFERLIKNPYLRHATGMFMLGIMMYSLLVYTGYYYIIGVGYSSIIDILSGILSNPWLLLLLFLCKLLATSLTLGSGASGGVFSPALFLGAAMGSTFGIIMQHLFPGLGISVPMFAIAGMAGMVSGATGVVITAMAMTFEQTRDYYAILPIMICVAIAYATRVRVCSESIYTLKLLRRGFPLPKGLTAGVITAKRASDIMSKDFETVSHDQLPAWAETLSSTTLPQYTIVEQEGKVTGFLRRELHYLVASSQVDKLVEKNFIILPCNMLWRDIINRSQEHKVETVLVAKCKNSDRVRDIIGVITPRELANTEREAAELMSS